MTNRYISLARFFGYLRAPESRYWLAYRWLRWLQSTSRVLGLCIPPGTWRKEHLGRKKCNKRIQKEHKGTIWKRNMEIHGGHEGYWSSTWWIMRVHGIIYHNLSVNRSESQWISIYRNKQDDDISIYVNIVQADLRWYKITDIDVRKKS